MVSYGEALRRGIRDSWCLATASAETFWGLVSGSSQGSPASGITTDLANAIQNGAGTLNGLVCNRPDTPPPPPPFTGGQCPGVNYDGFGAIRLNAEGVPLGNQGHNGRTFGPGPISITLIQDGSQQELRVIDGSDPPGSTGQLWAEAPGFDLTGLNWVRTDGQPDTCGDPPPEALPPSLPDVTIPTDIDYEEDDGTQRSINVPIVFGFAYADIDANIQIPVKVEVDADTTVNARLNLTTGDVEFNFGGGVAHQRAEKKRYQTRKK